MLLCRAPFKKDGITGTLFNEEGEQLAVTLEHSFDGKPKLPAGEYTCKRGMHTLHSNPVPFETFEVMDVPGHTGILFHIGNYNEDSDGCILVGRVCTSNEKGCMITDSKTTFDHLMLDLDLEGVDSFRLLVKDTIKEA